MCLGVIFPTTGLAIVLRLSPLLTNTAAGRALSSLSARNHRVFRTLVPLTPPICALVFVMAGTGLRPDVIAQREILALGGVYVLLRGLGKHARVYLGCRTSKVSRPIRQYLGVWMLPQAGLAIGLLPFMQVSPLMGRLGPALSG